MPAANKTQAGAVEGGDPCAAITSMVEKKIRSFEKKKVKLMDLKQRKDEGKELDKDQKEALSRMQTNESLLEFAKDMQKQFAQIMQETQKLNKKKAHQERLAQEQSKEKCEKEALEALLRLRAALDHLDEDNRHDFLNGTNGAKLVSQKEFEQIDNFVGKVSVSLSREDLASCAFDDQVQEASDHIYLYLHRSTKEVIGTTYKNLRELVENILMSDFFKQSALRESSEEHSHHEQGTLPEESSRRREGSIEVSASGSSVDSRLPTMGDVSLNTQRQDDTTGLAAASGTTLPPHEGADSEFDFFHQSEINPPVTSGVGVAEPDPPPEGESSELPLSKGQEESQYTSSYQRSYRGGRGGGYNQRGRGNYQRGNREWNNGQSRGSYRGGRGGRGGRGNYWRSSGGNYRGGGSSSGGGEKRHSRGGGSVSGGYQQQQ